jgi:hypothetical protein
VTPAASAVKVACIGAQMVYSDHLPRNIQFPAMLQVQAGTGYNVQNFGDCCSTVMFGYPRQAETHPYLSGQMGISPLDSAGMPVTPGYQLGNNPSYLQSISFAPDVVVIGAWGKHDTELANSLWNGVLDPVQFKTDYERLVTTYLNLPNKPRVIVSTPIPIPKGAPTGPTTMVILPVVKDVAAKYGLAIVDLYPRFLNHPELFKDDTHVSNLGGLETMSDAVYSVLAGNAPPPPPRDAGPVDMDASVNPPPPPQDGGSIDMDARGSSSDAGAPSGSGGSGGMNPGDTTGSSTGTTGSTTGTGGATSSGGENHDSNAVGCACVVTGADGKTGGALAGLLSSGVMWLFVRRRREAARRRPS